MNVSSAITVLLMCSPAGTDCMEIRSERTYETSELCREALPAVVARMNGAGRKVSGRCAVAEGVPPGVDPIVTCSTTGHRAERAIARVRVTRIVEGETVSDERAVPSEDRKRCG
jgi:hypothetical protein